MAETFDYALAKENSAAYEAQQQQEIADQLENDRDLLQSFLDWCYDQNDQFSFLAVVRHGEMYAELPEGGTIHIDSHGEIGTCGTSPYPWRTLYKIWLKTLE